MILMKLGEIAKHCSDLGAGVGGGHKLEGQDTNWGGGTPPLAPPLTKK